MISPYFSRPAGPLDMIMTNSPNFLCNTINFNCGLSDCHNMVATTFKENTVSTKRQKVNFRSYKNFQEAEFIQDLHRVPFHISTMFDDADDCYWAYETLLMDVVDEHAPRKQKYPKKDSPPFMNSELRRAIYKKKMLHNKYLKFRNKTNWELYRKQRNYVTKLRKQSIKLYFFERCSGGPKSSDFWPTIKPFLSSKSSKTENDIILMENNTLISDPKEVSCVLNDFYINIAQEIGINSHSYEINNHPSILAIKENSPNEGYPVFDFKPVNQTTVSKVVKKLNPKKATGVDQLPAKMIKAGSEVLSGPISSIFNKCVKLGKFPNDLKSAQVTPVFKKDDPLIKKNYRPVSILSSHSKVFELLMAEQLTEHFDKIFDTYLAAFRKGFGCQTTLLRLAEDWKRELDSSHYVGAVLMDLSKAFDCLPHDLIVAKLQAYGLTTDASSLLESYLSDRKQRVKIGQTHGNWLNILKGVPQGSILGPLLFNVFINDLFYFIKTGKLYNYADDNTVTYSHKSLSTTKSVLESESTKAIKWFGDNKMQANPDKFQAIIPGKSGHENCTSLTICGSEIKCEDSVKLLGVTIDFMLNFDTHVSDICRKAAKQINVLLRIGRHLTVETKILIYKSFIKSNFNYCPLVWHFCSKGSTAKMEKLQYRALRLVFNDFTSSYEALLERANMPTLNISRIRLMAIETFKILHKMTPIYLHDLVSYKESNYSFRYEKVADIPRVRTTRYGKSTFSYEAAVVWNSLPNELRKVEDFGEFRRLVHTWCGPSCKCSMCQPC